MRPASASYVLCPPPPLPLIPCALALQVPLEVERCQDRAECFNADLKADWERWQSDKRRDFRQLLTGLADRNIAHYEKVQRERSRPPPRWRVRSMTSVHVTLVSSLPCSARQPGSRSFSSCRINRVTTQPARPTDSTPSLSRLRPLAGSAMQRVSNCLTPLLGRGRPEGWSSRPEKLIATRARCVQGRLGTRSERLTVYRTDASFFAFF